MTNDPVVWCFCAILAILFALILNRGKESRK